MAFIEDDKLRLPSFELVDDVVAATSILRPLKRSIITSSSGLAWSRKCIVVDDDEVEGCSSELGELTLFTTFPIPDSDGVLEGAVRGNFIDPDVNNRHRADDEDSIDVALLMSDTCEVDRYLRLACPRFHEQSPTPAQLQQLLQRGILMPIWLRFEPIRCQSTLPSA